MEVTIVRASGLLAADKDGTSDPYVVVSLGEQTYKTEKVACVVSQFFNQLHTCVVHQIRNTLNPVWPDANTKFTVSRIASDIAGAQLDFHVYDWVLRVLHSAQG